MNSPLFERLVRIPVLVLVWAIALAALFGAIWIAGAIINSGLCSLFGIGCPSWY